MSMVWASPTLSREEGDGIMQDLLVLLLLMIVLVFLGKR